MTDHQIEAQIQAKGKTAPRVTPADIAASIRSEFYFTAADGVQGESEMGTRPALWTGLHCLTFCVLVLRNGFTVTGESACASQENFDAEIERQIARQNAVQKIWPLMGYALREQLAASEEKPVAPPAAHHAAALKAIKSLQEQDLAGTLRVDIPAVAPTPDNWRPRLGQSVVVRGYTTNGTDEHPGIITRVHGAGEGACVNVTAFPDLQSPKIFSSIPVYTSRVAARDALTGPSRANGYAYLQAEQ